MGKLKRRHSCDLKMDDRKDFVLPGDKDRAERQRSLLKMCCDETCVMTAQLGHASFSLNVIWNESYYSTLTASLWSNSYVITVVSRTVSDQHFPMDFNRFSLSQKFRYKMWKSFTSCNSNKQLTFCSENLICIRYYGHYFIMYNVYYLIILFFISYMSSGPHLFC